MLSRPARDRRKLPVSLAFHPHRPGPGATLLILLSLALALACASLRCANRDLRPRKLWGRRPADHTLLRARSLLVVVQVKPGPPKPQGESLPSRHLPADRTPLPMTGPRKLTPLSPPSTTLSLVRDACAPRPAGLHQHADRPQGSVRRAVRRQPTALYLLTSFPLLLGSSPRPARASWSSCSPTTRSTAPSATRAANATSRTSRCATARIGRASTRLPASARSRTRTSDRSSRRA